MDANLINNAQNLINGLNEEEQVKYIKKEKGLLERNENTEKVILTEDNRQVIFG